jgi:hypothetical protein
MNKLKYQAKTNNLCRYFLKLKITFITENYDGQNFLINSFYICFAIIGIEHDISLRMLTF